MELCRSCKQECQYVSANLVIRYKFYNKPVVFERFDCSCGNIQATKEQREINKIRFDNSQGQFVGIN